MIQQCYCGEKLNACHSLRFQGLIWILQRSNVCACANVVEAGAQAYDEASFVTWFKGPNHIEQVAVFDIRITFLVKLKRKYQISGKDVIKYAVYKKSRVFSFPYLGYLSQTF